jgi:zinc protease
MSGNSESLSFITLESLQSLYPALFVDTAVTVTTVGNITPAEIGTAVRRLNLIGTAKYTIDTTFPRIWNTTSKIVLVDFPGATQSEIRIVMPGPGYQATGNFYTAQLFNFPIGGNFNSRINLQLREVRGISYGAYSYFQASEFPGYFEVASGVKADSTGIALQDCLKIIKDAGSLGISTAETEYMRNAILQREALRYETFDQKLDVLNRIQKYKLPKSFLDARATVARGVTATELNRVGKPMMSQPMTIVVVGDAIVVRPQLESLGIPIEATEVGTFIW